MGRSQGSQGWHVLRVMALLVGPTLASPVQGQVAGPEVLKLAETPEALWFQPVISPQAVWYVPRTETRFGVVEPVLPGLPPTYRAAVVMGEVDATLAEVDPEWASLTLAPYTVRPTVECVLHKRPEMRFVQQSVRALGLDKGAGVKAPVCEFFFRLPWPADPALLASIGDDASAGRLIEHQVEVKLQQPLTVRWQDVHAALAAQLGTRATARLTSPEAEAAIDATLRGALVLLSDAMTIEERASLAGQMLTQLFMSVGTSQQLVPYSPAGAVTYHVVRSEHRL